MTNTAPHQAPPEPKPGPIRRFWNAVKQIKRDLHVPIEGAEGMSRLQKIKARFRFLFKRYGWKLVWGFLLYYLIRDSILYILLPYLAARGIWG
jgi:hypothetical protein